MLPKKKIFSLCFLLIVCFLPLFWRLAHSGLGEIIGLLSDAGLGVFIFTLALYLPHWLRVPLLLLWTLCQLIGQELLASMQRLPAWQDVQYLSNADFVTKTTAGFSLAEPVLALAFFLAILPLVFLPIARPRKRWLGLGFFLMLAFFSLQFFANQQNYSGSMAARYNPLHWFIRDALMSTVLREQVPASILKIRKLSAKALVPSALKELDLSGKPLLATKGKAKNVLIIVLEGMPGLYHPEIRQAMGVKEVPPIEMSKLAAASSGAMLIPDFTVHSHQTIRGLYALLCGDFSKLSWKTPKAFELQQNSEYAKQCLPAQMAEHGWSTHFLQGAGLGFMNKGQVMPMIGFQQVHGSEWFSENNPFPFIWGPIDAVFFRGAAQYIANLQKKGKPWMLTLLTVGTHQPYGVSDKMAAQYPSRKLASVALLDQAVAEFLRNLRKKGLLKNTLVVIVPDESHGAELADWASAWGLAMVLAPEQKKLPRLKQGGYGLVDVEASILDYLGLPAPLRLIGRSFFRDYTQPREMVSFTASKLRWHKANNLRYECVENGGQCWVGQAPSLLGPFTGEVRLDETGYGKRLFDLAAVLDSRVIRPQNGVLTMRFGHGEIRALPEKVVNDWTDNLSGAQYLDFPAQSTVQVQIRIKAIAAPKEGVRLWLKLKSWDNDVADVVAPEFPLLQQDKTANLRFSFANNQARQNFSFHLLGEGQGGVIQIDAFDIRVMDKNSKQAP